MTKALAVEVHFHSYKKYITEHPENERFADSALEWLQKQFKIPPANELREFRSIWRQGRDIDAPISFIDVAKFYNPEANSHQRVALEYLDEKTSEQTREIFDDIWFGRRSAAGA